MKWTIEEDQIIINARAAGTPIKEIFTELLPYRTYNTVRVRASKICPKKELVPWTDKNDDELISLREAGKSYMECAEILGRSHDSCKKRGSHLINLGRLKRVVDRAEYSKNEHSKEDLIALIKQYVSRDKAPCSISYQVVKCFGSWTAGLAAANVAGNIGGKMLVEKPTTLYLLKFDGFYKIGITQQTLKKRFSGAPPFLVVDTYVSDLTEIMELEKQILSNVTTYIPKNSWFERNGKTECFIIGRELKELTDLLAPILP